MSSSLLNHLKNRKFLEKETTGQPERQLIKEKFDAEYLSGILAEYGVFWNGIR